MKKMVMLAVCMLAVQVWAQDGYSTEMIALGPATGQQQEDEQGRPIVKRRIDPAVALRPGLELKALPLKIAQVGAPAINCKFDTDCRITVNDSSDHFTLAGTTGDAFLQSRTFPPGQPGTAAAGLTAYLYRLDLRNLTGTTAAPCVDRLTIELGAVASIDYDDDGSPDQVFVVTSGGLGSVAPSSVAKVGSNVIFNFSPPVCCSSSGPGAGESSYFFGVSSQQAPRAVTAQLRDTLGNTLQLDARAPDTSAAPTVQSQSHSATSTSVNNAADWHPVPPSTTHGAEDGICAGSPAWTVSWIQFGFPAFSIPAGQQVTGIEVSVKYRSTNPTPVQLTSNGSFVGSIKNVPAVTSGQPNCTSTAWASIGGDGDLWGAGLTRAGFNAGQVGFRLTQSSGPPITTIDIDAVKLTVYYASP